VLLQKSPCDTPAISSYTQSGGSYSPVYSIHEEVCARLLDMGVIYVVEQKYNYHRLMFTTDLILPKNRQNPIIKPHWKILRESQAN